MVSENDGLIGSINDLNNKISSTQGKKDARGNVGDQAKVLTNHVKVGKSWGREEGEAFKGKAPSKAKCTFETFDLKRGHAWKKEGGIKLDCNLISVLGSFIFSYMCTIYEFKMHCKSEVLAYQTCLCKGICTFVFFVCIDNT